MAKIVKKNFPVQGLGCAACVARVQSAISNANGVTECNVSLASNTAQVTYDKDVITSADIKKTVQDAGYDLIVVEGEDEDSDAEADSEADRQQKIFFSKLKTDTRIASVSAVIVSLLSMGFGDFPYKGFVLWLISTPVVFWCGRRFFSVAFKQACHANANMDTLVALSTLISYSFSVFNLLFPSVWTSRGMESHLYFESSAMIVAFILLGRLLEESAKHSMSASIRELAGLQPKVGNIAVGDVLTIKPGERIPIDGEVISGDSYVDESMLTGEPIAASKALGDRIFAGTINQRGVLQVKAEKVGKDTMLSSIVKKVKDAQGSKAAIQKTVDKVASVFVPTIMVLSVLTLIVWTLFQPSDGLVKGLLAMVSVLVIACPCSLGLATPTALVVGIGVAARKGILIKDADSLQVASKVDVVAIDKTGTLSLGRPKVLDAKWNIPEEEKASMMEVLLSMELKSEHPLAAAVVEWIRSVNMSLSPASLTSFEALPGKGIKANVGDDEFTIGNDADGNKFENWEKEGRTVVFFRKGGALLAAFAIADELRPTSAQAVEQLRKLGVNTIILSGDNENAVKSIASEVGITDYRAGILPLQKAEYVKQLQSEGKVVAMVGDGINDSAALASADLSVAMGSGSDISINASMVTVVSSDLLKIAQLVKLSGKTVKIIRQNLFWAFFYNCLAVPIAAGILYPICGFLLNPMIGAACMAMSSVCVVCNSLRLKRA